MRTVDVDAPTDLGAAVARYRERHGIGRGTDEPGDETLADALCTLAHLDEQQVDRLFEAGYDTRHAIEVATVPELVDVEKIRPEDAYRIVRAFDAPGVGDEDDGDDPGLGESFG
jgi:hypothetical protein